MGPHRHPRDRPATLVVALLVLLAVVGGHFFVALPRTDGNPVYLIDDTYIHMAIAKNLVRHGVWGITPHEFSSASSSIVYPLLLAGSYAISGVNELAPLLINLLFGIGAVFLAESILARRQVRGLPAGITLLAFVLFTPLPAMVLLGMEHTLQIVVDLAFVYVAARVLSEPAPQDSSRTGLLALYALAPAVTLARYEGMFLILVVGLLMLVRGRVLRASCLGALAALPLVLFGIVSLRLGDLFFPNSILMKGKLPALTLPGILRYAAGGSRELAEAPHLLVLLVCLVVAATWAWVRRRRFWSFEIVFATIVVGAALVHVICADTGWYGRYEAYLVALGILALALLWRAQAGADDGAKRPAIARFALVLIVMVATVPMLQRAHEAVAVGPASAKNIYEQAWQVGHFVRDHYNEAGVVAHDVGALTFFGEPRLVDLFGLGSSEFVRIRRSGESWDDTLDALVEQKDARIAILYENWWRPLIPRHWIKVGEWRLQDECLTCGDDTVAFYAIAETERERLARCLLQYRHRLPPGVVSTLASR